MLAVIINGIQYQSDADITILELCKKHDIPIPYLCYHPDLKPLGNCRICVVEADGRVVSACNTRIYDGMCIVTQSTNIDRLRKMVVQLMLGNCPEILQENSDLSRVVAKMNIHATPFKKRQEKYTDHSAKVLLFDNNKCIMCGKCIQKCQTVQEVFAIGYSNRGHNTKVGAYLDRDLAHSVCVFCGQCSISCPSRAIIENDEVPLILAALKDPTKHVVVQPSPSTRASIGETQGMAVGSKVTGKLVSCLKALGFDRVFDTCFGADLTIVEEGTEVIDRITNNGVLPLITSCSPGWVLFLERFYPDLIPLLSSCKSPMQMMGALIKTYYAQCNSIDPKDIVSVALMPCVAKKFEARRPEMRASSYQDVDYVLTTREFGEMITASGIDFPNLPDTPFDSLMGTSTGAGVIFGSTGGVMEAALRFTADKLENKDLEKVEYYEVRGMRGVKEAHLTIAGIDLNIAVSNGLANARKLLDLVQKEPSRFHFIEVMACEGGCIGGGGQPQSTCKEIIKQRSEAIYSIDKNFSIRKSHKNPEIIKLYKEFLGEPGGHHAHKLLHTHYTKRNRQ